MRISDWSSDVCSSDLLLILDDLAYVAKDQAETSVLFELICARYERLSMLITANQPFGEWNRVFPDPAMTHVGPRSEEHTSELQSLIRNSYAVFCLKTQNHIATTHTCNHALHDHIDT